MSVLLSKSDQDKFSSWFYELRHRIIKCIEKIEADYFDIYKEYNGNGKFEIKKWDRAEGGGGEMGIIRGNIFEKMGVNVSIVSGNLSPEFAKQLPGTENGLDFWASGVSLVAHPRNPFVPPIHMNTRCISTNGKIWLGGGIDLNPIIFDQNERDNFHLKLKTLCEKYNPDFYQKFSKWCDEYFWLPHRKESRGIGGIFFDYIKIDNWEFLQDLGQSFIEIYDGVVRNKVEKKWNDDDRKLQLEKRGRYAEFNLLYDRGIKFGLMTGGNSDAMMMSLPPLVSWY